MNTASYPERVKRNILPFSVSPLIHVAITEWIYADKVKDVGRRTESCDLCNQEHLRYQYLIRNESTKREMWVGSSCILNFGVAVMVGRKAVYGQQAKSVLETHLDRKRKEISINALNTLLLKPDINNSLVQVVKEFIASDRAISPKQLSYVAWQLSKNDLNHDITYFRMSLKKKKYQEDFRELRPWQIKQIWPALNGNQRKVAERNR